MLTYYIKFFTNYMSLRQIGYETTAQKYVIDVIKKVERVEIKDALKDENE